MILRAALLCLLVGPLPGCLAHHSGAMPGEPAKASWAEVAGARVRFTDDGKGPAVVMIHGFAAALETWTDVAKELGQTHRVITLDLKGFGWTDRPEGDYSPTAQARLVLALLDRRGVDRFAVVAHSWGSSVALALARLAPKRVQRLALYDAWVWQDQLPGFFLWARYPLIGEALFGMFYDQRVADRIATGFYDKGHVSQRFVDAIHAALKRPGTRAAALAATRDQRFAELEKGYGQVKQPTLLLWGQQDHVAMLRHGQRLASTLPAARLKVYARCGHFPMIEAAAASTRDLIAFLAEGAP